MNIAILGKSSINAQLADWCAKEGFVPFLLEEADEILGFEGEKGGFKIKTPAKVIEAGYVIVSAGSGTAKPKNPGGNGNIPLPSLASIDSRKFPVNHREPVVFLLDYPHESPAYMTYVALDRAVALAGRMRKVICLAKFMRTSAPGLEELYMEGRRAGVTFIKYNDLSINYSEEEGFYHINVADDFGKLVIDTRFLAAGTPVYDENAEKIAGKLRLKEDEQGFINVKKHFMYPVLTNRKGIYFVDACMYEAFPEDLILHIKYILTDIKNGLDSGGGEVPDNGYAEIDAGKCAFCYTCFRVCPHSAMVPDYENSVMKNLKNSCQACGICVTACPAKAIEIKGRDRIELSSGAEVKRLEILCCENSGEIAAYKISQALGGMFNEITITPVSCAGEISVERILSALKNNTRVLVASCMDGACRHFEGNKRARRQVEKAKELLKAAGGDESRVEYISLSHAMPAVMAEELKEQLGISSR